MAFSLRECIKNMKDLPQASPQQVTTFTDSLKQTNDKHLPAQPSLKTHFVQLLRNPDALSAIQHCMNKYHTSRKIKIKDGLFGKFTDLQSNTVRIALLWRLPWLSRYCTQCPIQIRPKGIGQRGNTRRFYKIGIVQAIY